LVFIERFPDIGQIIVIFYLVEKIDYFVNNLKRPPFWQASAYRLYDRGIDGLKQFPRLASLWQLPTWIRITVSQYQSHLCPEVEVTASNSKLQRIYARSVYVLL
jgi:hypothetical protein